MQYFLDFDRTVFDTDAMYIEMRKHVDEAVIGTLSSLDSVETKDYLFKDALDFFNNHKASDIFIVSSCIGKSGMWDISYQREKVERSGIGKYVSELLVVETTKVNAIKKYLKAGTSSLFVDDLERHLHEVHEHIPEITACCIDRTGGVGNSEFPIIKSLNELDGVLKV